MYTKAKRSVVIVALLFALSLAMVVTLKNNPRDSTSARSFLLYGLLGSKLRLPQTNTAVSLSQGSPEQASASTRDGFRSPEK